MNNVNALMNNNMENINNQMTNNMNMLLQKFEAMDLIYSSRLLDINSTAKKNDNTNKNNVFYIDFCFEFKLVNATLLAKHIHLKF